jgi:Secretion system C-terminal sorting domain
MRADNGTYIGISTIDSISRQGDALRLPGTGEGKVAVGFAAAAAVNPVAVDALVVKEQSLIRWTTANESHIKDFAVHHSTDGNSWRNIGFADAIQTNSSFQNYSFAHISPVNGNNYYRIVQRNGDGELLYSKTVKIFYNGASSLLAIYPNPVTEGKLNIILPADSRVLIYDDLGVLVFNRRLSAGTQQLDLRRLRNGLYRIKAGKKISRFIAE